MDRHFIVLVFAAVISSACTVQKPIVNPFQIVENDEELDNAPFYTNVSEESEHEQYFNPSLYRPPPPPPLPYGLRHMMARPPSVFDRSGYPRPMYLPPELQHKYRTPFQQPYSQPYIPPPPLPMALWIAKINKHPKKQNQVPLDQPTTIKTPNETTTSPTTTTTTTTTTTSTTTVAPEPTTEVTTEIVEVTTTEAPKQQTEEPTEEPKQRQLPIQNSDKNCGSDEESTQAYTTIANEEQPTTISGVTEPVLIPQVTTENVPAPTTEVAAPTTEATAPTTVATSSEEEIAPIITLRHNNIPVLPEMALPLAPMYPRKTMYAPAYSPMPYFSAIHMDPYDAYHGMDDHHMYARYYGF